MLQCGKGGEIMKRKQNLSSQTAVKKSIEAYSCPPLPPSNHYILSKMGNHLHVY